MGFVDIPVATVAFYGPADTRASDVRKDPEVGRQILAITLQHGVKTVLVTDGIIGCPHEEGVDYPDGEVCPACPFLARRDRWTGETIQ